MVMVLFVCVYLLSRVFCLLPVLVISWCGGSDLFICLVNYLICLFVSLCFR